MTELAILKEKIRKFRDERGHEAYDAGVLMNRYIIILIFVGKGCFDKFVKMVVFCDRGEDACPYGRSDLIDRSINYSC